MTAQETAGAPAPDAVAALTADGAELDAMIVGLDEAGWRTDTPAPGWTVAHQVAHLAATFKLAGLAAADPESFRAMIGRMSADFRANVDAALERYLADPPPVLFSRWQEEKSYAEKALGALPGDQMVPWLVRPVPATVLACAGMMELFGHGQDIADALGIRRTPTDRIKFLVTFAVRTWDFGYQARGLQTPEVQLRYELTAPSGARWTFGPEDSGQVVSGSAADLCLLVTRRRHLDDLDLAGTGEVARHWLTIAQAYRGPAGPGRTPGQFAARS